MAEGEVQTVDRELHELTQRLEYMLESVSSMPKTIQSVKRRKL